MSLAPLGPERQFRGLFLRELFTYVLSLLGKAEGKAEGQVLTFNFSLLRFQGWHALYVSRWPVVCTM